MIPPINTGISGNFNQVIFFCYIDMMPPFDPPHLRMITTNTVIINADNQPNPPPPSPHLALISVFIAAANSPHHTRRLCGTIVVLLSQWVTFPVFFFFKASITSSTEAKATILCLTIFDYISLLSILPPNLPLNTFCTHLLLHPCLHMWTAVQRVLWCSVPYLQMTVADVATSKCISTRLIDIYFTVILMFWLWDKASRRFTRYMVSLKMKHML